MIRRREEPYGDVPAYGNVVNGDGRRVLNWLLGIFSGLLLITVTAWITWEVGLSSRVTALESGQALTNERLKVTNEKLQAILDKLPEHRRGT